MILVRLQRKSPPTSTGPYFNDVIGLFEQRKRPVTIRGAPSKDSSPRLLAKKLPSTIPN